MLLINSLIILIANDLKNGTKSGKMWWKVKYSPSNTVYPKLREDVDEFKIKKKFNSYV